MENTKKKQIPNTGLKETTQTGYRKLDHVRICLTKDIEARISTMLEDISLIHKALPELDYSAVDTSTEVFGKELSIPLICAAITGGHPAVTEVNEIIACTAEKKQFGMGVGSQRAALESENIEVIDSFSIVRNFAPTALIIGNIGAPQIVESNDPVDLCTRAIEMINADALAIHTNPLQEVCQYEGDTNFMDLKKKIKIIADSLETPIILKEVGSGISLEDAKFINQTKVAGIDVGGTGGTSWAAVESERAFEVGYVKEGRLGQLFRDWGIPTAASVLEVRSVFNRTIIATGGVRNGLQAAKLIAIGADVVGMALPFLKSVDKGKSSGLEAFISQFTREFKTAMFLTGAKSIADLKSVPVVITGRLAEWCRQRNILI